MKTTPTDAFKVLYRQIKGCQTEESEISGELLESAWDELRTSGAGRSSQPTPAIMAALLLFQDEFRYLVTGDEYAQLEAIVTEARSHYLRIINPNNPVGRRLADAIKEERET